jgi:hypothetical protein
MDGVLCRIKGPVKPFEGVSLFTGVRQYSRLFVVFAVSFGFSRNLRDEESGRIEMELFFLHTPLSRILFTYDAPAS